MSDKFEAASDSKTCVSNDLLLKFINNCKGLSEMNKKIFVMKAVNEYTHREIAQKLNITESSSATRFHQAKTFLKQKMNTLCI